MFAQNGRRFFELFEDAARRVQEGAVELVELLKQGDDPSARAERIREIGHEGDRITREAIEALHRTAITPMDREDIHALASRFGEILELIDETAGAVILFGLARPREAAVALAGSLSHSADLIAEILPLIRHLGNAERILRLCINIQSAASEARRLKRQGLAALFRPPRDPIEVIQWKELYETLDSANRRCRDVAHVLEGIVLKNV